MGLRSGEEREPLLDFNSICWNDDLIFRIVRIPYFSSSSWLWLLSQSCIFVDRETFHFFRLKKMQMEKCFLTVVFFLEYPFRTPCRCSCWFSYSFILQHTEEPLWNSIICSEALTPDVRAGLWVVIVVLFLPSTIEQEFSSYAWGLRDSLSMFWDRDICWVAFPLLFSSLFWSCLESCCSNCIWNFFNCCFDRWMHLTLPMFTRHLYIVQFILIASTSCIDSCFIWTSCENDFRLFNFNVVTARLQNYEVM